MLALLLAASLASPSAEALAILERHECSRCHVVEGVAPAPAPLQCAGCHQEISGSAGDAAKLEKGRAEYGPAFDRFVRTTAELYCHVPSLAAMGRLRASWLRAFLENPYDVRPHMSESMIRHALTPAELDALVKGWGAVADAPPGPAADAKRVARGARLYDEKGCAACHLFGNHARDGASPPAMTPTVRTRAMAPDLRHVRDRLNRDVLERWLVDPKSVKADAAMPATGLTREEAALLADFLLQAPPGAPAIASNVAPPAYDATAPVPPYEEVEREVFRFVCWHCHSDAEASGGDGGPGNTGGFGFAGVGLSFSSYEELMNGALGPDGKRRSVFRPGVTGEPVLLERLRLRYAENARDLVAPGRDDLRDRRAKASELPRGMPLGLPALTAKQFSLVERWVKGGRPAP